eukprot:GEMP01029344.1.p1 GENE.GEMP01029344.1~~GEMP01029344.1.p1  ORF type:complete len:380 (+),score=112.04 GEMP01029344.1:364-1503(+)
MLSAAAKQLDRVNNVSNDALLQLLAPQGNNVAYHHHAVWPTHNPLHAFHDQRQRDNKDASAPMAVHRQQQSVDLYHLTSTESPPRIGRPEEGNNHFHLFGDPQQQHPHPGDPKVGDGQQRMVLNPERGRASPHIAADPDSPRWIARSNEGGLVLLPVNPRNVRVEAGKILVINTPPAPTNHANTLRGQLVTMGANPRPLCSCALVKNSGAPGEDSNGVHQGDAVQPSRATQNGMRARNGGNNTQNNAQPMGEVAGMNKATKKMLCDILVDGKLPRRRSHLPEEIKNLLPVADTGRLTSIGSKNHPTQCVPCMFWTKRLCSKGAACVFCHIAHPGTIRPKPSKDARHKRQANLKMNVANAVEDGALKSLYPVVRAGGRVK